MRGKLFVVVLIFGFCGAQDYKYGDSIRAKWGLEKIRFSNQGEDYSYNGRRDYDEKENVGKEEYREIGEYKGKDDSLKKEGDTSSTCSDSDTCDEDFNYDKKYFYEPCEFPDDLDCVRHFFAAHSECSLVHDEYNRHVYRERYTDFFTAFNLTFITTKTRLKAEGGKIIRFYIDRKTENLVMAVDFKELSLDSKLAYFLASRRGREPAVAADFARGSYPGTLTAIIPLKYGLSLKDARVTAYIPDSTIRFVIGPKVVKSKDPAIEKSIVALFANVPTAILEYFLTEAPSFFLVYLQKNICDFGIPYST